MKSFKLKNRALAALLCVTIVGGIASTFFLRETENAEATDSLPAIQALNNSSQEYQILEIVPDVSQAAFAWYVGDSEPVSSKKLTTAYGSDSNTLLTKYQEVTDTLQNQNYLLAQSTESGYSGSILEYLGPVSVSGSTASGGFQNSEWFLRYVLDWTDGESMAQVKVSSISPEYVTPEHIALADMVIISGGFYYTDWTVEPAVFSTDSSKNISTASSNAIISAASSGMPVILDRRAYQTDGDATLESNRIFHSLLGADPRTVGSGVYGTVFYFSSFASGEESANAIKLSDGSVLGIMGSNQQGFLVTSQFNTPFDASISGLNGPFGDVLANIQLENSKRNAFQDVLLSEEITMAKVVQYLVSGAAAGEADSRKDTVTILSLQPGDSSDIARYSAAVHDVFALSQPTVTAMVGLPTDSNVSILSDQVPWEQLEAWTGVARSKITVVEMSAREFSLQTEDVSSLYDLIYIGNDISGGSYGLYSEDQVFNANGQSLAASGTQTYFASMGEVLTKPSYSYTALENDISVTKYSELISFVKSGRPVILAPYLCAGLNWDTSNTTPSSISIDKNSNLYSLLEKIAGQKSVLRQDILIVGADGVAGTSDDAAMVESVVESVHISTPTIEFATLSDSMPMSYSSMEESGGVSTVAYTGTSTTTLEYIFKISNVSEGSGPYTVGVELDCDGDNNADYNSTASSGFTITELLMDGDTYKLDSNYEVERVRDVDFKELNPYQYYLVSFTLPESVEGIFSWTITVCLSSDSEIYSSIQHTTYVLPSTAAEVSVLQVYGGSDSNMETSSLYEELLTTGQMAIDTSTSVRSVTLEEFDSMIANGLSVFNLKNEYDLLVLGDIDYDDMKSYVLDFVEGYLSWGGKVLFADAGLDTANLPFYGGFYSQSGNLSSETQTGLNQLNTNIFKFYPYNISELLTESMFVLNEGNYTYSNVAVNNEETNGKIFVNTLATIVGFFDNDDSSDTETSSTIRLWSAVDPAVVMSSSLTYYVGTAPENVSTSPQTFYFSLPYIDASSVYFTIDKNSLFNDYKDSDGIEYSFSDAGKITNLFDMFSMTINSEELSKLELADGESTEVKLNLSAFETGGSGTALAQVTLNITIIKGSTATEVGGDVDLFQQGTLVEERVEGKLTGNTQVDSFTEGNDYIYLIPQG